MARWKIMVSGKGIRRDTVDKIVKAITDKFGGEEKVSVAVTDATPPESRADRFSEAQGDIGEAKGEIESLRDELQERLDNMPENLQQGSKAGEIQEAIDNLETVIQNLEDAESCDVSFPGMY